jgi:putative acetyltransferase
MRSGRGDCSIVGASLAAVIGKEFRMSAGEIAFSAMGIGDYDEVVAFWRGQEGIGLNESDEREPVRKFLERNAGLSLVARREGKIVAAALCGHDGRRGYLHHVAVLPELRRKGLGKEIVERCVAKLRAEGIVKCNVFLFDDNVEGMKFWEAMGYRAVNWSVRQRVMGRCGGEC